MRPAVDAGSVHSLSELDTPLPTSPDEKKAVTVKRLSYVLGFLYAVFFIILSVLVHVNTALIDEHWGSVIMIYVTVTGLIILCLLILDIKLFTRRIRKQVEELRSTEEEHELEYMRQLDEHIEENSRDSIINEHHARTSFVPPGQVEVETIEHSYCFAQGRHAGSVYLKFGATVFALGRFVHALLLVAVVHYSIMVNNGHCISATGYTAALLECLYCIVQLFFVLYYSNLIIAKHMTLARIGFLHIMAGNISLWIWTVTTEIKIAFKAYIALQGEKNATNVTDGLVPTEDECDPTVMAFRIFDVYSAYLYPFSVEFNFLLEYSLWFGGILGSVVILKKRCKISITHYMHKSSHFDVLYLRIFSDLYYPKDGTFNWNFEVSYVFGDKTRRMLRIFTLFGNDHFVALFSIHCGNNASGDVNSPHPLDIHINCRNAMCGLFSSLFIIVILIAAIILSFVFGSIRNDELQRVGIIFADSINLVFHTIMLVVTVIAFHKTQALDINKHPIPWLDDVLLYICVPAFFLESILTVIPTITALHILKFLDTIIMSLQMIVQIAFIIDGLRRCSNSRKLRRTRPGRELVLLLLVTNVAMWFLYTFSFKSPESKDIRYAYYGKEVWLSIGHLCTPIIMFFRFHSSVCIADIWSYAYKLGVEDH